MLLQVEYVFMEKQQENAYKEAIVEYRAILQARIAKCSKGQASMAFDLSNKRMELEPNLITLIVMLQTCYASMTLCHLPRCSTPHTEMLMVVTFMAGWGRVS